MQEHNRSGSKIEAKKSKKTQIYFYTW
jgi:hypothetical protein